MPFLTANFHCDGYYFFILSYCFIQWKILLIQKYDYSSHQCFEVVGGTSKALFCRGSGAVKSIGITTGIPWEWER